MDAASPRDTAGCRSPIFSCRLQRFAVYQSIEEKKEHTRMLKMARNLTLTVMVAAMTLSAADPFLGAWKMNPAKSKYNPGPAPKSATMTYTQDGDWIVGKNDTVGADDKATTFTNRYKRDGKEYPYQGANGTGTVAVKA